MTTGRRSPAGSGRAALVLAIALLWAASAAAHRKDEYLQAARIGVEVDRINLELDLAPGIAVVDRVLPDIDLNLDGQIAAAEARTYVDRVLNNLMLDIDGRPLRLIVTGVETPAVQAMRRGEAVLRITAVAALPPLAMGEHRLYFRNAHRSDISVYLANALAPATDAIRIGSQTRDVEQRDLVIRYRVERGTARAGGHWLGPETLTLGVAVLLAGYAVSGQVRRRRSIV